MFWGFERVLTGYIIVVFLGGSRARDSRDSRRARMWAHFYAQLYGVICVSLLVVPKLSGSGKVHSLQDDCSEHFVHTSVP